MIHTAAFPAINTEEEIRSFKLLQNNFASQYEKVFPDMQAPKTVVIVPSLTMDQEILTKIRGVIHYEERMLCLLMLLRMPRTHVIYVTSMPVDQVIVDYYLHLLPGITGYHARQRLSLLSCFDASRKSLTEKILERPRLLNRIRQCIPSGHIAHLACFNVTCKERTLAVRLGLPIYGCDPDLYYLGSKTGSRKVFSEAGVQMPAGTGNLKDADDLAGALADLKRQKPLLSKAVVKINDGFSGDGNAVFSYEASPSGTGLKQWIGKELPVRLKMVAADVGYENYINKFKALGGAAEEFIEGHIKRSPSVQCRINPLGKIDVISTHDQVLGGESGQVFMGASFPADSEYSNAIANMGEAVSGVLKNYGVIGRFSVDFISVKEPDGWKNYAIEINLRKGGTTHPFLMLQFLTDGNYDPGKGIYTMPNGQQRFYYATDNLEAPYYKGLTPYDLIEIAMFHGLHYDSTSQQGVMFHLIGALSQYGKLGVVCIGDSHSSAIRYYNKVKEVLEREC
ncbi:MAG: peptide ligase PGM1-related protein [Chitinophagaceae bacterium]|nr:peptide ligase PGM1-related protein [Chitinophagaceae bacterium]